MRKRRPTNGTSTQPIPQLALCPNATPRNQRYPAMPTRPKVKNRTVSKSDTTGSFAGQKGVQTSTIARIRGRRRAGETTVEDHLFQARAKSMAQQPRKRGP